MNRTSRQKTIENVLMWTLLVALCAGLFVAAQMNNFFEDNHSRYTLLFNRAPGLLTGNTVTVSGVPVGRIKSISLEGHKAKIQIAIDPSVSLYKNAEAHIRTKSLLGEKYIDLFLGSQTQKLLPEHSVIVSKNESVDIDTLLYGTADLLLKAKHLLAKAEATNFQAALNDFKKSGSEVTQFIGRLKGLLDKVEDFDEDGLKAWLKKEGIKVRLF